MHSNWTSKISLYMKYIHTKINGLYKCNESGLCGSPWPSPEVTITWVLTSLSELHFPSSCTRTLIASSPDTHLWDSLSHTHTHTYREVLYCPGWHFWAVSSFSVWSLCFDSGLFLSFWIDFCLPWYSCLSSDILVSVTDHCLYVCVNSY